MRIKCPYSDIMLELPGDRTDMKFTCPACHKVHRVTVRISTPGEDPAPVEAKTTRTVHRTQPPIPKKYATGAYAPVVDIPIDANFVLLDEKAEAQREVDLGIAAGGLGAAKDVFDRKTETVGDRRGKREHRDSRVWGREAGPDGKPESDSGSEKKKDEDPEAKKEPEPQPKPETDQKPEPEPRREPENESKPEPEPQPEPKLDLEIPPQAEPEPAEPEPAEPKPEPSSDPQPELKLDSEPWSQSKPEPGPEPFIEPLPDLKIESEPLPQPEPEPKSEPPPELQSELKLETEPWSLPEPQPKPEPLAELPPDLKLAPEPPPESEPEPASGTSAENEPKTPPELELEPATPPAPEPELVPDPEPELKFDFQPLSEPAPESAPPSEPPREIRLEFEPPLDTPPEPAPSPSGQPEPPPLELAPALPPEPESRDEAGIELGARAEARPEPPSLSVPEPPPEPLFEPLPEPRDEWMPDSPPPAASLFDDILEPAPEAERGFFAPETPERESGAPDTPLEAPESASPFEDESEDALPESFFEDHPGDEIRADTHAGSPAAQPPPLPSPDLDSSPLRHGGIGIDIAPVTAAKMGRGGSVEDEAPAPSPLIAPEPEAARIGEPPKVLNPLAQPAAPSLAPEPPEPEPETAPPPREPFAAPPENRERIPSSGGKPFLDDVFAGLGAALGAHGDGIVLDKPDSGGFGRMEGVADQGPIEPPAFEEPAFDKPAFEEPVFDAPIQEQPRAVDGSGVGEADDAEPRPWDGIPGDDAALPLSDPLLPPLAPPSAPRSERTTTITGRGARHRGGETAVARKKKALVGVLAAALAFVLGVVGYLGWQQRNYNAVHAEATQHLARADAAWSRGDTAAAVSAARAAEAALNKGAETNTAAKIWNKLGRGTGLFGSAPDPDDQMRRNIRRFADRERSLASFRSALDPSNPLEVAELLGQNVAGAGDPALVRALEKTAVGALLEHLHANADLTTPEEARAEAKTIFQTVEPVVSEAVRQDFFNQISAFNDSQRRRLAGEAREEIAAVAEAASLGDDSALLRYRNVAERIRKADVPELSGPIVELAEGADRDSLLQLAELSAIVDRAVSHARTVFSRQEGIDSELDRLIGEARQIDQPNPSMATIAAVLVDDARNQADDLLSLKNEIFNRLQTDMRRNRESPGARLALRLLQIGADDPEVEINPYEFRFDPAKASMSFAISGLPAHIELGEEEYETTLKATVGGYTFVTGWSPLFHKPIAWMSRLARDMRAAGVDPVRYPLWELLEGPGGLMGLSAAPGAASGLALANLANDATRQVFWEGRLSPLFELPPPSGARMLVEDFRQAAEALHDAVMGSGQIPQTLRQALKPVLMGTYQKPDPRDYFDSAFCRRLIEADYLETYILPMPSDIQSALDHYRFSLSKLEAGYDEFSVDLGDGGTVYAVVNLEADLSGAGRSSDQDPETGETIPKYSWRVEKPGETVFFSPLPSRFLYAFFLAEYYDGIHQSRPGGVPRLTEVWHATQGRIASYRSGENRAIGDSERWNAAIAEDANGRFDPSVGPPGWNFPLHVLQRDDQGDPVLLATPTGVVMSPDFSDFDDPARRRAAEDAWLDSTARTFSSPGELGLIFHHFFRYCSDSPLPELPNLIGSHYGLSDTHQTVYQSMERRWVGRLIGDCDDLAEFFQALTRRQGKLSHVMQLPGHAACGYVQQTGERNYRFVVLQTGPVVQFNAPTLNEAVEIAYRSFDRGEGISHMTTDAVPLLLRFADEETRTPFVLSARIFTDEQYAKEMIQVQSYWHEHVYSAAIKAMEDMLKNDKEIGSIKELGSLYERVGFYDRSEELRREELQMVRDNPQAAISTLLELVQLHFQDKNRRKALEALGQMEAIMLEMIRKDDAESFFRAMTFRSFWAMFLSRLGQPARAWNLVRYDATITKRQLGRVADPVLRTMVMMYERMTMQQKAAGGIVTDDFRKAMNEVRGELEEAFGKGYFKADDSYTAILGRYFLMGRYAVADFGRDGGVDRLLVDGPYPSEPKDQTRRGRGVQDEDWQWFRITPQLYYVMAMEMLDRDEYPEFYDPEAAKPMLEAVKRAVETGTGLGSDVAGGEEVVKADLALSFLNRDLDAFRACMSTVKEKDYSSLYDDAAMTFGLHCGLIPLEEFQNWIDVFHEFFPGSQHYFKVVYRALDKEHYDHALMMAEATPRFFPGRPLLSRERDFVRGIIPDLKERKSARDARETEQEQSDASGHDAETPDAAHPPAA